MGLFSRQFDVYRLQKKYQLQINVFFFSAMAAWIVIITLGAIKLQNVFGIKPGTPVQLTPHGWLLLGVGSVAMLIVLVLCALLGWLLHAVYLVITGQLGIAAAFGAVFLSKYPPEWFKPTKRRLSNSL